jgi:hypothetical protein
MSDTKDLKYLLDKLKSEVGPVRQDFAEKERPAVPAERPAPSAIRRREGAYRPYQPHSDIPAAPEKYINPVWSENKEIMLFGMLASLLVALGGMLAGLNYIVMTGAALFAFFSLVTCIALLRVSLFNRRPSSDDHALAERLDALSKRVETLSLRSVSSGSPSYGAAPGRDAELDHKVEELRVLVKSLSKAIEAGK